MALLKLGSMASFKGVSFTTTQWPVGQLGIPIPEWLARCRTLKLLHMLDIQTSQPSMLMVLGRAFIRTRCLVLGGASTSPAVTSSVLWCERVLFTYGHAADAWSAASFSMQ